MKAQATPRIFLVFAAFVLIPSFGTAYCPAQETPSSLLPEAQIHEVAIHILEKADKVNCKPQGCKILVTNFTVPSGLTSQLGIQLADQFSKEIVSQQNGIQVVDRSILQEYLQKERFPPELLANDKAARWLGKQLSSTAVLVGKTQIEGSVVRIHASLLSCNKEKAGITEVFTLPLPDSKTALSGIDPIQNLVSKDEWPSAPTVYRAGVGGVSQPACRYCPDPRYTTDARTAKFEGTVLLKAVVSPEGKAISAHIVRGIPFGLNEMALDAVSQWKFTPAMLQGKPVAVEVAIEIGFRLLN